jgi:hypothetical protein
MSTAWQQQISGSPYPRDTGFFSDHALTGINARLPAKAVARATNWRASLSLSLRARFQCGRDERFA